MTFPTLRRSSPLGRCLSWAQDQLGAPAGKDQVERELRVVRAAYAHSGAAARFSTTLWEAFQGPDEVLGEWLRSDQKPLRPKETP